MENKIFKFTNAFKAGFQDRLYDAALNSNYTIGWADTAEPEKRTQPCLGSHWNKNAVEELGILKSFKKYINKTCFKKFCKIDNLAFVVVNLTKPCDPNFIHTHSDQFACVYYINPTWQKDWAGETLFFNQTKTEVIQTSLYEPNKLVIFDGSIPHTIRAQNITGPSYRFTLTLIFNKK